MQTDVAESPQASTVDHPSAHILEAYCSHCEHEVDAICPNCQGMVESSGSEEAMPQDAAWDILRRILNHAYAKRNSKFTIECFFIAAGWAEADGISMTEVSVRWGVTKAAVSKYCREICETVGIPPSRYMRTEENAAKFRLSNRRPVKI